MSGRTRLGSPKNRPLITKTPGSFVVPTRPKGSSPARPAADGLHCAGARTPARATGARTFLCHPGTAGDDRLECGRSRHGGAGGLPHLQVRSLDWKRLDPDHEQLPPFEHVLHGSELLRPDGLPRDGGSEKHVGIHQWICHDEGEQPHGAFGPIASIHAYLQQLRNRPAVERKIQLLRPVQ